MADRGRWPASGRTHTFASLAGAVFCCLVASHTDLGAVESARSTNDGVIIGASGATGVGSSRRVRAEGRARDAVRFVAACRSERRPQHCQAEPDTLQQRVRAAGSLLPSPAHNNAVGAFHLGAARRPLRHPPQRRLFLRRRHRQLRLRRGPPNEAAACFAAQLS